MIGLVGKPGHFFAHYTHEINEIFDCSQIWTLHSWLTTTFTSHYTTVPSLWFCVCRLKSTKRESCTDQRRTEPPFCISSWTRWTKLTRSTSSRWRRSTQCSTSPSCGHCHPSPKMRTRKLNSECETWSTKLRTRYSTYVMSFASIIQCLKSCQNVAIIMKKVSVSWHFRTWNKTLAKIIGFKDQL